MQKKDKVESRGIKIEVGCVFNAKNVYGDIHRYEYLGMKKDKYGDSYNYHLYAVAEHQIMQVELEWFNQRELSIVCCGGDC